MAWRETAKISHNFKICEEFMFFEINLFYSMGQEMVWISWTPKISRDMLGFIFPCWTMMNGFIRWKASLTIHQWSKLYGTLTKWHVHVVILNQYCRFSLCWECHVLVIVFFGNALDIEKHTSRAWLGTEFQSEIDSISWTLHIMIRNREINCATWMDK